MQAGKSQHRNRTKLIKKYLAQGGMDLLNAFLAAENSIRHDAVACFEDSTYFCNKIPYGYGRIFEGCSYFCTRNP